MVYVAQVPSPHSMRMFTEVGRRVLPHCTGVGKALLSVLPDDQVRAILARTGMPAQTEHTITSPEELVAELAVIRARGYAIDDAEQEAGVRCVAVPGPEPAAGQRGASRSPGRRAGSPRSGSLRSRPCSWPRPSVWSRTWPSRRPTTELSHWARH